MLKDAEIIQDTITLVIKESTISATDHLEIYKQIISSQHQTYSLIIMVFLGIIALFAGATWLYNKKLAKAEIVKETNKIFREEKIQMMKEFRVEFEKEINFVKGESARLFANSISGIDPSSLATKFYWWMMALKYYNSINRGKGVRWSAKFAIEAAKSALEKEEECQKELNADHKDVNFLEIIENLPDELFDERKELESLTKKLLNKV